jgi:hypothetical protein
MEVSQTHVFDARACGEGKWAESSKLEGNASKTGESLGPLHAALGTHRHPGLVETLTTPPVCTVRFRSTNSSSRGPLFHGGCHPTVAALFCKVLRSDPPGIPGSPTA